MDDVFSDGPSTVAMNPDPKAKTHADSICFLLRGQRPLENFGSHVDNGACLRPPLSMTTSFKQLTKYPKRQSPCLDPVRATTKSHLCSSRCLALQSYSTQTAQAELDTVSTNTMWARRMHHHAATGRRTVLPQHTLQIM